MVVVKLMLIHEIKHSGDMACQIEGNVRYACNKPIIQLQLFNFFA
jgi:hypothetical protein